METKLANLEKMIEFLQKRRHIDLLPNGKWLLYIWDEKRKELLRSQFDLCRFGYVYCIFTFPFPLKEQGIEIFSSDSTYGFGSSSKGHISQEDFLKLTYEVLLAQVKSYLRIEAQDELSERVAAIEAEMIQSRVEEKLNELSII